MICLSLLDQAVKVTQFWHSLLTCFCCTFSSNGSTQLKLISFEGIRKSALINQKRSVNKMPVCTTQGSWTLHFAVGPIVPFPHIFRI